MDKPYPAPNPNNIPIINPITLFSPKIPIFFWIASESNGLLNTGIKSSNLFKGFKITANSVIKWGTVTPGIPVISSMCLCHTSPAFNSKIIWILETKNPISMLPVK